jgi:hypothetical protein
MKKGWYIPQLILIRQNISWIKSYRIGGFSMLHPSRLKYFKCPGWGHHSSLSMLEVWNQQPKRDKQLFGFYRFFLRLCSNPCSNPTKKKSRTPDPDRTELWGLAQGNIGSRKTGCLCCIHQRFLYVCMYLSIYIYTICLKVCYGNRVHLWRRYLYVPIKHDDFT